MKKFIYKRGIVQAVRVNLKPEFTGPDPDMDVDIDELLGWLPSPASLQTEGQTGRVVSVSFPMSRDVGVRAQISARHGDVIMENAVGGLSVMYGADFRNQYEEVYPLLVIFYKDGQGEIRYNVSNANNHETLVVSSEGYKNLSDASRIAHALFPAAEFRTEGV